MEEEGDFHRQLQTTCDCLAGLHRGGTPLLFLMHCLQGFATGLGVDGIRLQI